VVFGVELQKLSEAQFDLLLGAQKILIQLINEMAQRLPC
jgi:hypothetical protein